MLFSTRDVSRFFQRTRGRSTSLPSVRLFTSTQVVLVFRWVDDDLQVHEDFVGLHETDSTTADALVAIFRDTLLRLNIKLENCRGQCHDRAGVMSGRRSGVAKTLQDEEKRAVFTHCYGHALNLAAGDCIKQCKIIQSAFDTVAEMSKLVKKSPKRDAIFQKLKLSLLPILQGFVFCAPLDGRCEQPRCRA